MLKLRVVGQGNDNYQMQLQFDDDGKPTSVRPATPEEWELFNALDEAETKIGELEEKLDSTRASADEAHARAEEMEEAVHDLTKTVQELRETAETFRLTIKKYQEDEGPF